MPALCYKDISGLDVPLNNARRVRCVERLRNFDRYRQKCIRFHRTRCDAMLQCHPFQVIHGNKTGAVTFADFVNRTDVGMVQRGCRACFPSETFQRSGVLRHGIRQEFEGDEPSKGEILGLVYDPHSAATEFLNDAVVRDGLADHWAEMLGREVEQVNEGRKVGTISAPWLTIGPVKAGWLIKEKGKWYLTDEVVQEETAKSTRDRCRISPILSRRLRLAVQHHAVIIMRNNVLRGGHLFRSL